MTSMVPPQHRQCSGWCGKGVCPGPGRWPVPRAACEEPAAERELGGAVAIDQEPVVADPVEPVRQSVEQEAADELVGRQCHNLRPAVVAVILPAEDDLIVRHADQAGVGYRDAMGVAAEIGLHLLGTAEGWLGIDDPFDAPQLTEPAGEGGGFGECRKFAEETEFAGREVGAQRVEEQPAEQAAEHADRQEEPRATGDPARVVERWTAAGHDAMDVRVVMQALAPGVKHGDEADLGAEMLRVGGDGAQRLGRHAQQDGIDGLLVLEGDLGHWRRQREHDAEVWHRLQFGLPGGKPLSARLPLALRAMPVTAEIVDTADEAALGAGLRVTAQRRRPTQLDGAHHPPLDAAEMTVMRAAIRIAVAAENICHFQTNRHGVAGSGGRYDLQRQPIERALAAPDQPGRDLGVAGRGRQTAMIQENLDDADIGAVL
jgi:hypothetical protein